MSDEIYSGFWDHLEELRKVFLRAIGAILVGAALSFYFSSSLIDWLILKLPKAELFLFSPVEGFIAVFRLSFWLGTIVTSPYWIWGIMRFIQPALRGEEKQLLPAFFLLSIAFIGLGFFICFHLTLPLAIQYLYAFNWTIGTNLWGFGAYLDFVLMLFFAHGIAFEMGALLLLLVHAKVIKWPLLVDKRRHACVASLIIGALLTPPDVLTQICIAIPLMGFYEVAICYGKMQGAKEEAKNELITRWESDFPPC